MVLMGMSTVGLVDGCPNSQFALEICLTRGIYFYKGLAMCVLRICCIVVSSGDVPCLGMLLPVKFNTCVHVASHVCVTFTKHNVSHHY